jgi:peptide/nickel transport system permease protein
LVSNKPARYAAGYFIALALTALMADFLANDKPLYCRLEGKTYFPVIEAYCAAIGLTRPESRFLQEGWYDQPYERAVFPPIPYGPGTIDRRNLGAKSPFGPQRTGGYQGWHWLGTDMAGHDVAAGLIHGARTALLIGLIGMLTATLLGIFFGAIAGYFGDGRFRTRRAAIIAVLTAICSLGYLAWAWLTGAGDQPSDFRYDLLLPGLIALLAVGISVLLYRLLIKSVWGKKEVAFPFDFWISRLMETLNAIPTLLLILALLAVLEQPSIYAVMVMIGMVRWTGIARLVRAELLKVSAQPYIEAAHALGYSSWRILFRHALPNSLGPVWVTLAFGMAGAILIEASLSYLGIGLPVETVTWGSFMRQVSSSNIRPWWLAVFPGTAIFFTVLALNMIGEHLGERFDPRAGQSPGRHAPAIIIKR